MRRIDALIVALAGVLGLALCADDVFAQGRSSAGRGVVVATVGDEPIHAGDVARLLVKVTGGQDVNPAVLPVLQAQVLAEIVDRRLVLAYARRTKSGAGRSEIDSAVAGFKSKLTSQGRSLAGFLEEQSMTEADLRRQIAWRLLWPKYLARYVTDKRLASYFAAHRRELDGTEVSVSHILLRPPADAGPRAMADLIKRAQAIREAIGSGKISFAEAARKHSAGPSARDGGRLGPIARHGAMSESFSRAAFALEVGRLSEPVTTRFGVHLIRCDAVKPGSKPLAEVRNQIEEALARELIDKLARLEREHTPVKFTGKAPHFKPGTRELVAP